MLSGNSSICSSILDADELTANNAKKTVSTTENDAVSSSSFRLPEQLVELRVVSHAERLELNLQNIRFDNDTVGGLKRHIANIAPSSGGSRLAPNAMQLRMNGKAIDVVIRQRLELYIPALVELEMVQHCMTAAGTQGNSVSSAGLFGSSSILETPREQRNDAALAVDVAKVNTARKVEDAIAHFKLLRAEELPLWPLLSQAHRQGPIHDSVETSPSRRRLACEALGLTAKSLAAGSGHTLNGSMSGGQSFPCAEASRHRLTLHLYPSSGMGPALEKLPITVKQPLPNVSSSSNVDASISSIFGETPPLNNMVSATAFDLPQSATSPPAASPAPRDVTDTPTRYNMREGLTSPTSQARRRNTDSSLVSSCDVWSSQDQQAKNKDRPVQEMAAEARAIMMRLEQEKEASVARAKLEGLDSTERHPSSSQAAAAVPLPRVTPSSDTVASHSTESGSMQRRSSFTTTIVNAKHMDDATRVQALTKLRRSNSPLSSVTPRSPQSITLSTSEGQQARRSQASPPPRPAAEYQQLSDSASSLRFSPSPPKTPSSASNLDARSSPLRRQRVQEIEKQMKDEKQQQAVVVSRRKVQTPPVEGRTKSPQLQTQLSGSLGRCSSVRSLPSPREHQQQSKSASAYDSPRLATVSPMTVESTSRLPSSQPPPREQRDGGGSTSPPRLISSRSPSMSQVKSVEQIPLEVVMKQPPTPVSTGQTPVGQNDTAPKKDDGNSIVPLLNKLSTSNIADANPDDFSTVNSFSFVGVETPPPQPPQPEVKSPLISTTSNDHYDTVDNSLTSPFMVPSNPTSPKTAEMSSVPVLPPALQIALGHSGSMTPTSRVAQQQSVVSASSSSRRAEDCSPDILGVEEMLKSSSMSLASCSPPAPPLLEQLAAATPQPTEASQPQRTSRDSSSFVQSSPLEATTVHQDPTELLKSPLIPVLTQRTQKHGRADEVAETPAHQKLAAAEVSPIPRELEGVGTVESTPDAGTQQPPSPSRQHRPMSVSKSVVRTVKMTKIVLGSESDDEEESDDRSAFGGGRRLHANAHAATDVSQASTALPPSETNVQDDTDRDSERDVHPEPNRFKGDVERTMATLAATSSGHSTVQDTPLRLIPDGGSRVGSAEKGCQVGSGSSLASSEHMWPPYGYDSVQEDDDHNISLHHHHQQQHIPHDGASFPPSFNPHQNDMDHLVSTPRPGNNRGGGRGGKTPVLLHSVSLGEAGAGERCAGPSFNANGAYSHAGTGYTAPPQDYFSTRMSTPPPPHQQQPTWASAFRSTSSAMFGGASPTEVHVHSSPTPGGSGVGYERNRKSTVENHHGDDDTEVVRVRHRVVHIASTNSSGQSSTIHGGSGNRERQSSEAKGSLMSMAFPLGSLSNSETNTTSNIPGASSSLYATAATNRPSPYKTTTTAAEQPRNGKRTYLAQSKVFLMSPSKS